MDFFSNEFISDIYTPDRLMDFFYIKQGTQFSKEDAYLNPGQIPVYTAATDGPAYYVEENIPGKVMITGLSLIWRELVNIKTDSKMVFPAVCFDYNKLAREAWQRLV